MLQLWHFELRLLPSCDPTSSILKNASKALGTAVACRKVSKKSERTSRYFSVPPSFFGRVTIEAPSREGGWGMRRVERKNSLRIVARSRGGASFSDSRS